MSGAAPAGAALAAAAAACFDGAVALQALEVRALPAGRAGLGLLARLARRPRWLAATALAALGWPFQLGALALAPLTLVQPTLALGLVLLLVLGARLLGEPAGLRDLLGVGAIAVGVGLLAWAAPENSRVHAGAVTLAALLGALGALAALPWLLRRRAAGTLLVAAAGCAYAGSALTSKLLVDAVAAGHWPAVLGWAAATVALAGLGFGDEMAALQRVGATWVATGAFVLQTVVPVLCAPVLVGEAWGSTPLGGAVVAAGLAAVTAGSIGVSGAPGVRRLLAGAAGRPPG